MCEENDDDLGHLESEAKFTAKYKNLTSLWKENSHTKTTTPDHARKTICNGTYHVLRASPVVQYVTLKKYFSHPTLPIKMKLGLQTGGRLLMATHLNQWNYLANQKQGAVNKYDLTVFVRLFHGSESHTFFQGHRSFPANPLDLTAVHYQRFPVQGHILSTHGDAPSLSS
jgi:hypothetical protein